MSKKIRRPSKNVVPMQPKKEAPAVPQVAPLSGDPDTLVAEWRRLQGILAHVQGELNKRQETINQANSEIASLQQNGLQINGAAQMVHRILVGMGIDPNKYVIPEEDAEDELDGVKTEDFEEDMPDVVEPEEVTRSPHRTALRRRFNR